MRTVLKILGIVILGIICVIVGNMLTNFIVFKMWNRVQTVEPDSVETPPRLIKVRGLGEHQGREYAFYVEGKSKFVGYADDNKEIIRVKEVASTKEAQEFFAQL